MYERVYPIKDEDVIGVRFFLDKNADRSWQGFTCGEDVYFLGMKCRVYDARADSHVPEGITLVLVSANFEKETGYFYDGVPLSAIRKAKDESNHR